MSLFALETATRIAWDALFCFTFLFLNTDKQRTLWTTFGLYERVHCKDESLTCGLNEFCFLLSSICKSTTRRIWETGEIWKYSKCTELFWSYEQCIVYLEDSAELIWIARLEFLSFQLVIIIVELGRMDIGSCACARKSELNQKYSLEWIGQYE